MTAVTDPAGNSRTFTYNDAGDLTEETDALGNRTRYTYHVNGQVESITHPAGEKTLYTYYPGGQVEKISYPDGKTLSYSYDRNGNIVTRTNQDGYSLTYDYDCMGRIIRTTDTVGQETIYEYDVMGNVTSVTDENGNTTRYQYTPSGKLSQVTDALGNKTIYHYDSGDNMIYMCQEGEGEIRTTQYERNPLGQVEAVLDVLGRAEYYEYDSLGRVIKKRDRENFTTTYAYTPDGKPKQINYEDGREVFYTYNPLRQLIEIQDWLGTTRLERDTLGRIEKVTDPAGRETSYEWGKLGEKKSIIYPDGRKVRYKYDDHLRLQNLITPDEQEITYRYDQVGRLVEKDFGKELKTSWKYDITGRLMELVHEDWKGILDQYRYGYDAMGNRISIEKERRGLPEESGHYQYSYDALQRLSAVTRDNTLMTRYTYDAFGNRQGKEEMNAGSTTAYTYNALNQLMVMQEEGLKGSNKREYVYDNRGNLIREQEDGEVLHSYEYGALNRMEKFWDQDENLSVYTYNGLNQLIKHDGTELMLDLTTPYHNLIQTREEGVTKNFYWDSNLAAMEDPREGKSCSYLLDELGSPLRVEKRDGTYESYEYDAFGEDVYGNQGVYQPFGYTGEFTCLETKNIYLRARYYSPATGRFLAEDTYKGNMGDPLSLNLYTYCNNNPILYIDPSGHTSVKDDDIYGNRTAVEEAEYWISVGKESDSAWVKAISMLMLTINAPAKTLELISDFFYIQYTFNAGPYFDPQMAEVYSTGMSMYFLGALLKPSPQLSAKGNTSTKSGTIWDNITGTADKIPNTEIPATFKVELDNKINYLNLQTGTNTLWTNANATEHMGEYVARYGSESWSVGIRSQTILESYSMSLNQAMSQIATQSPGRYFGAYGNWELGINTQTGVVYHAQMLY